MARRQQSGCTPLLVLLGLCLAALSTAFQYVQDHWLEIRPWLIFAACVLGLVLVNRLVRRFKRPKVTEATAVGLPAGTASDLPPVRARADRRWARPRGTPARWIPPEVAVSVQGITISSGLFYLGQVLHGPEGDEHAHGLVIPELPITKERADVEGTTMPYWPSYSEISPSARRAFLEWMAGGRKDPAYGLGHVFMFFYGLEHRFFLDGEHEDAPAILAEVSRLLATYGHSNSFKQYASEFIVLANLAMGRVRTPRVTKDLLDQRAGPHVPADVRLHLGRKLAASNALSADDALTWLLSVPETSLRTAAVRCFDEFAWLWRLRFTSVFPEGFRVDLPKERLRFRYVAASRDFEVDIPGPYQDLPDISGLIAAVRLLDRLAQACTDELDPFSRYLGRQPNGRTSVHAALLLPQDLQTEAGSAAFRKLKDDLAEAFGQRDTAAITMRQLIEIVGFESGKNGKVPKTVADQMGEILDRIDVGIEPDRRYGGGSPPTEGDQVFIFRAPGGGPIDANRPEYLAMRAQVEVAALAAAVDGEASNEDFRTVMSLVRSTPELSRVEQARLLAYSVTLFKSPLKQARVMKRLSDRTETERRSIAKAAAMVVGASGHAGADEVRFLERLHRTLGLPREDAYTELHRAAEIMDEPSVIAPEKRAPGIPITKETPQADPVGLSLDPAKLARVRRETQAVSELLSQIFAEEGAAEADAPHAAPANGSIFAGLDGAHGSLLEAILAVNEMPRAVFENIARKAKLLPDGALETINDWAYDRLDEPLIEDGDPIRIPADLRDRLAELKEAS